MQLLRQERDQHQQWAEVQQRLAAEQKRLAEEQSLKTAKLQAEILRLQVELERYKRWYYGPRADQLVSVLSTTCCAAELRVAN